MKGKYLNMKRSFVLIITVLITLTFSFGINAYENTSNMGAGLIFGYHEPINAKDSYRAVYDSGGIQFGIIFDYRILDWLDLEFRALRFSKSGMRVVIDGNGNITETDNPEDLEILSLTLGAKYIIIQNSKVAPYIGLAFGNWNMKTESSIGDYTRTFDKSGIGAMIMAGAQYHLQESFSLGLDLSYSSVPDMIGSEPGSTSYYYNEKDIGGFSVNLFLMYRF